MNRFFTLLLAASCLTAVGQVPDYVPTDSLVGWYSFENDFLDQSGNGNHGIPNGDVPFSSGLNGDDQSMSIDEAGSYVHLEGLDDFDFANESITFSAWVNWTGQFIGNEGDIIRYDDCASSGYLWGVSLYQTTQTGATNTLKAFDHNRFGADNSIEVNNTLPPANLWTHVVCVRDVDLGRNQLFRDGVLIGQTSSITTPVPGVDREMLLGICGAYGSTTFLGSIDECGIWNRALTEAEIQDLFSQEQTIYGCTDSAACNFSAEASSDDGSCTYGCQFCGVGTVWDESTETCIEDNTNSACDLVYDGNGDGVVGAADLLGLLTEFGAECTPETAFTCGDPISYQGYDYETVQIGEQCWFAENLRAEYYQNGDAIPSALSDSLWSEVGTNGAFTWPSHDNATEDLFGKLYNGWVVLDSRGVCPDGWEVPTSFQLTLLMDNFSDFASAGEALKDDVWWNGSNSSGFTARPAGAQSYLNAGFVVGFGSGARMWGTSSAPSLPHLHFSPSHAQIDGNWDNNYGMSIRCIKDSE